MRSVATFFLVCLLAQSVFASQSRSIDWYVPKPAQVTTLVNFDGAIFQTDSLLPVYTETVLPEVVASSYKVSVSFPIYVKLTPAEEQKIQPVLMSLSDTLQLHVNQGINRKKTELDLSFVPLVRKGQTVYKLIAFNWEIDPILEPGFVNSPTVLRSLALSSVPSSVVASTAASFYTSQSVLATGKWKKLSVAETGIYQLSYDDIVKMGFNPAKFQIYGYGGTLLKEDFSQTGYQDDLPPVPMWKDLGKDGVFNSGDKLFFYAKGVVSWAYNSSTGMMNRTRNPYAQKGYYFAGESTGGSLSADTSSFTGVSTMDVTTYTDPLLYENELVNMGEVVSKNGTGREFYGEDLTAGTKSVTFTIPNLDTDQKVMIQTECVAHSSTSSYCTVTVDSTLQYTHYLSSISSSDYYTYGKASVQSKSFLPVSSTITVDLNYLNSNTTGSAIAFLNYINLNVRKILTVGSSPFLFRDPVSLSSNRVVRYIISNADENTRVFDVTDAGSMTLMNGQLNGTDYSFTASAGSLREYACVNLKGSIPKPTQEGTVTNQNLHGYQPDMVIISPDAFRKQAERLAAVHEANDGLAVLVVSPEQVYNEFSSGTPDATAYRRLMKCFYDKAETEEAMPDYLLLFGGGVYDNRYITSKFTASSAKNNWLLTYQSSESLVATSSYVTDDYFGFLDDSEGGNLASAKLDIGIGRFPVNTLQQAKDAVDKTIRYIANKRKGPWKNRLLYLADDGDNNEYNMHLNQAEALASTVETAHPQYMVNRIYVSSYMEETLASGTVVPGANAKFAELLNQGLFMLNYIGHGSTTQWTSEKILTQADVKAMTNPCLPLWVTATCDFCRFDAPDESGGESAFLNANGGAIALFTTTRVVISSNNYTLNQSFIQQVFSKTNGKFNTLGKIMQLTKNASSLNGDSNKLNFALIGDPALRLTYPELSADITSVNGKTVTTVIDTLEALSQVTMEGHIFKEDGSVATDFDGLIYPTVLDAPVQVNTLGNDGADIIAYFDQTKALFSGKDSVTNGHFKFSFVVPKDISYSFEQGKINLYASQNDGITEASGAFDQFALGGTNFSAVTESDGPVIHLYLNDTTFTTGQVVNETPTFIARLADVSGLNTSGNSIGHDLQLIIDEDPDQTFTLNNYFTADVGSYQSGTVQYVLPTLTKGTHSLSFRAWDLQNNVSTGQLSFVVKSNVSPRLSELICVRQPSTMLFRFAHNRPDVNLTVKLTIFNMLGQAIWSDSQQMQTTEGVSDLFEWNYTSVNGLRVPGGIYHCLLSVTDADGGQSAISQNIQVLPQ